jgi:energy-coupling factor transporter ATP-binding protein EcfA2
VTSVQRIDRQDFIENYWDYKPGQHVSILGSTGNGKTTLALQLLEKTAHPELPGIVLAMKPKDDTVDKFHKKMKDSGNPYRRVRDWPARKSLWAPGDPSGYIVEPKHYFDDEDEERHAAVFKSCLMHSYKTGNRIIFADEAYSLAEEMGLDMDLVRLWSKGRSMGTGLWAATQKPTHVPLWMYSQASHLFLSYDPDKRARDRYREISGADPKVIEQALLNTDEFEWLHIQPKGRQTTVCIVSA